LKTYRRRLYIGTKVIFIGRAIKINRFIDPPGGGREPFGERR
jgi:hypothetical protein